MRFLADGPDIPDELLFAQDEGKVVFFCGAGVSMEYAGLPSFTKLAKDVMNDLGATDDSKAARLFSEAIKLNEDPSVRGAISADHIFTALTRDFYIDDIHHSVAKNIKNKNRPNLKAHEIILNLAGLQRAQTRLVTTNFDLLFEEFAKGKIKSSTRSNLPNIKYADNNWGIVHLHGKVEKDYSGPNRDGFVLLSSEFGDAYLAQGWARDFVKDILEKYTAVFIGYSADDPPVRYLLEGLQQSSKSLHGIYAFQKKDSEAIAQWQEKGVMPIEYNLHAELWSSLSAWSNRSKNPKKWRDALLSKAQKGPEKLLPHERGMVAHLVNSQLGASAFVQKKPVMPAEWLCVFDKNIRLGNAKVECNDLSCNMLVDAVNLYGIDNDFLYLNSNGKNNSKEAWDAFSLNDKDHEDLKNRHATTIAGFMSNRAANLPFRLNHLALWVGKIANQRIAVWWAGQQSSLHPNLLDNIKAELRHKRKSTPKLISDAWSDIFQLSHFYNRDSYKEYELTTFIGTFGWNNFSLFEYSKLSAPFLKQGQLYEKTIPRDKRKRINKKSLIKLEVDYPKSLYNINIFNGSDDFLPKIIDVLRINLEQAIGMEKTFSLYTSSIDSIEPDDDIGDDVISRTYGLSGYVLHFSSLFKKLLGNDIEKAREEFKKWPRGNPIFDRLIVWASGASNLLNEVEFTNEILSLSDDAFWPFHGERDLLLSLRNKWNELSKNNIERIEKKILKIPVTKHFTHKENIEYFSFRILNRLHWLNNEGCILNLNLEDETIRLQAQAPKWKAEYANHASESNDGRGGWVKKETNWSELNKVPLSKITEKAHDISSKRNHREFVEYVPFTGLSRDKPLKAIAALSIELKANKFDGKFWITYLSNDARKNDKYKLVLLTAGRLIQIPDENMKDIILEASWWFKSQGKKIKQNNPIIFNGLWQKFVNIIKDSPNSAISRAGRQKGMAIEWVNEAVNSVSGSLAELWVNCAGKGLKVDGGFPDNWLEKAEELLEIPNDSSRFAMTIFSMRLFWFHSIDSKWTEEKFIKNLEDDNALEEDRDAVWSGFIFIGNNVDEKLYLKIKPYLMKIANKKSPWKIEEIGNVAGLLLLGWGAENENGKKFLSNEEMRQILLNTSEDLRHQIIWCFSRWIESEKQEINWSEKVIPFLENTWPKQKKIKTSKTSAQLCEFTFDQSDNFPAVSQKVASLVRKIENDDVFIRGVKKTTDNHGDDEENLAEKYPEDYLNLLYAILSDQREYWPYGANEALKVIEESAPALLKNPKLIKLKARQDS